MVLYKRTFLLRTDPPTCVDFTKKLHPSLLLLKRHVLGNFQYSSTGTLVDMGTVTRPGKKLWRGRFIGSAMMGLNFDFSPEGQGLALTGTLMDVHYPITRGGCPFFASLGSQDVHEIRFIFLSLRRVLCCFHELEIHILARRIVFIATKFVTRSTCQIVLVTYYACKHDDSHYNNWFVLHNDSRDYNHCNN